MVSDTKHHKKKKRSKVTIGGSAFLLKGIELL